MSLPEIVLREPAESEERFRRVFEDGPVGIWLVDHRRRTIEANPALTAMLGYSEEEFRDLSPLDITAPEDREPSDAYDSMLRNGDIPSYRVEKRYLRKSGEPLWVDVTVTGVHDDAGRYLYSIGIIQDIDERRVAETAAAEREAELMQTQTLSHVGSWSWDIVTDEVWWSPELYRIMRLDPSVRPTLDLVTGAVHPDHLERFQGHVAALLETGTPFADDLLMIRSDGAESWQRVETEVTMGPSGPIRVVGSVQDFTESKQQHEALQRARDELAMMVGRLERDEREVSLVDEMSDFVQSCASMDELAQVIRTYAMRLFPSGSGAVFLIARSRNLLEPLATWGRAEPASLFAPQECWGLRRGRVHHVVDPRTDIGCRHAAAAGDDGYICVPMMAQGESLGLVHLRHPARDEDGRDAQHRMRLAVAVAEDLAPALANFQLRETLRDQSIRDPLTGLFNRRYLEESLQRELARATRDGDPMSILSIDIDHFKLFNDTYGHLAGDAVLSAVGNLLSDSFRAADIACRFGGEEFNILLPQCSREDAMVRAEALRSAVKDLQVSFRDRSYGGLSVSIGVALFPEDAQEPRALLEQADRALYRAKETGRDRVVAAEAAGTAG